MGMRYAMVLYERFLGRPFARGLSDRTAVVKSKSSVVPTEQRMHPRRDGRMMLVRAAWG